MSDKKKSGSENREKTKVVGVRVNEEEYFDLSLKAEDARLSVPAFVRKKLLDEVFTQGRKPPPSLDKKLLSMILGQLGKVGSNINQIARRLNEGGSVAAERVTAAVDDFEHLRDEIFKALKSLNNDNQGQKPRGGGPSGQLPS